MIAAVVFDLDGVLIDSEQLWDEARQDLAADHGIAWPDDGSRAMLGMSSKEWPVHMAEVIGVPMSPEAINADVVARMHAAYERSLPLLPGAREAVERLGARWPLGLASSSNREVIDVVLDRMGVTDRFAATVSSEEVARGKPSPDVWLEALRRMGIDDAASAVAIEDSSNGMRSAHAAGLKVIAIPNPHFPPDRDALALAGIVVDGLPAITAGTVEALG